MKEINFRKIDLILLIFILIVAFVFRLYKINTPLADYHSWRQVDTAAVTRNFIRNGFDLFKPTYDDLSSIESGKENPKGYRFVEFPIYNAIFGYLAKLNSSMPLEVNGRLTTAFFSLIVLSVIYYLCLKESGRMAAFFASLVFAIFPAFVFFSRVILPETTGEAFAMLSILFVYLNVQKRSNILSFMFYVLSVVCFATSLLIKPTTIFFAIPILFLMVRKYEMAIIKKLPFYLFFILSVIPLLLWRNYINAYPEGIPANSWLIAQVNTYQGLQNIFLRPAFFRWIFFERINNNILGGYLTFFLLLGLVIRQKRNFLISFVLAALAYLLVFEGGNVQHEYYQTLILPAIAMFIGLGVSALFKFTREFVAKPLAAIILIIVFGLSFFFSYYRVREFYNYPKELPQIGKIVESLTEPDAKIITDRVGDTTLLYLTNRRGSPAIYKNLEEFKSDGYTYFLTLHKEKADEIRAEKKYKIVFENDQMFLFHL